MDCLNPPKMGYYGMDVSEIRAQLRFSWSLTGTLSMCLQDPSQPLPRHSKPDAPHSQPPVPAPLPAVLGLAERRHQHHGQQQPAGPGELSGCRVPGQQHTTRSRCRVADLRQGRAQWGNRIRPRRAPRPFPSRLSSRVPPSLRTLQAGICFVLYRSQLSLSSPPTPPCPGHILQDTYSPNPATRAQAPSARIPAQPRVTPAQGAAPGRSWRRRRGGGAAGGAEPGLPAAARRRQRSGGMLQWRATGLAGLAAVLLGARGCRRRGRTAGV